MNEAKTYYDSDEYERARQYSSNSYNRHVVLVEGINQGKKENYLQLY